MLEQILIKLLNKNGSLASVKVRNLSNIEKTLIFSQVPSSITRITEALYWCFYKLTEFPSCKHCGNFLTSCNFHQFSDGYSSFCSKKCSAKSITKKEKTKQTNLDRYGVGNVFQSEEKKAKIKQTNLDRYGTEHFLSSSAARNKIENTVKNRYSVKYSVLIPNAKEKTKQTNLDRYGVGNVFQSEEKKAKIKQTNLDRYGVEHPAQSNDIIEKTKQTNLERYGCLWSSQNKEIRNKQSESWKYNFTQKFIQEKLPIKLNMLRENDNIIPHNWRISDFNNINQKYNWQHEPCGFIFQRTIQDIWRCPKCFTASKPHQRLIDELIKLTPNTKIEVNNRQQIKPLEIDIWFPDYQVGIEVNGAYWHQDWDNQYKMLKKTEICGASGGQLLHFWDFEIDRDVNLVANLILTKLGLTKNKIGARKLTLIDISWQEAKLFLDTHHLQGAGAPNKAAGLYLKDELLACAVVGKARYSKKDEQELYRFCVKRGWSIPGALSRLVKHMKNPSKNLISYADRRYSNGRGYLAAGFQMEKFTPPSYFYSKNKQYISRIQAQKHKLPKLLGSNFKDNLSESENMLGNGYLKLSDCGTFKLRYN